MEDFQTVVAANAEFFLLIYAPWCPRSEKLLPIFSSVAQSPLPVIRDTAFAKVDGTTPDGQAVVRAVEGAIIYPVIRLIYRGKIRDEFMGPRTESSLTSWALRAAGPPLLDVEISLVTELSHVSELLVVAYLTDASTHWDLFKAEALKHRHRGRFAAATVNGEQRLEVYNKLVSRTVGPVATLSLAGGSSSAKISTFVSEMLIPYVAAIGPDNFREYFAGGDLFWIVGNLSHVEESGTTLVEAAKRLRGRAKFVWLSAEQYGGYALSGLGVHQFPVLVLQRLRPLHPAQDVKENAFGDFFYSPNWKPIASSPSTFNPSEMSPDSIVDFYEHAQSGMLPRTPKSRGTPTSIGQRAGADVPGITTAVASTVAKLVFRQDSDTLLLVVHPESPSSKKMHAAVKQLAQERTLSDMNATTPRLDIVKMNGVLNVLPEDFGNFTLWRYPALFFVRAGQKVPTLYSGPTTVAALKYFVSLHQSRK